MKKNVLKEAAAESSGGVDNDIQKSKKHFLGLPEDMQEFSTQQEIPLADLAVSHCRAVVAALVPHSCPAEAFPCDISLPAGGGTACRRFCRLDYRADCFNFGIP
jgi:hypothetical protein